MWVAEGWPRSGTGTLYIGLAQHLPHHPLFLAAFRVHGKSLQAAGVLYLDLASAAFDVAGVDRVTRIREINTIIAWRKCIPLD